MNIQFSNPGFLWWLLLVVPGVVWLCRHSDSSLSPWRLWMSCFVRLLVVVALTLAMAGLQ